MVTILIVEDSDYDLEFYKKAVIPSKDRKIFYGRSAEEALHIMETNKVDIFFLDMDLPGMDGFELAGKIRKIPIYSLTPIVFISECSDNQLDAFKAFHCYDYVVKPIEIEDLSSKLNPLIEQVALSKKETKRERFAVISTLGESYYIPTDDICFAEAQRNACLLHMENRKLYLKGITLKEVIQSVDQEYFLRCHRSYAINVKKIFSIKEVNYRLWAISTRGNDKTIDLSKRFYPHVMEKHKQLVD